MKHSSKSSVSGTSNETFLKTESASSLQGSAEPNSPDTSISNGGKTHPHKIDALKNWFRTRPIVEKFCALPTSKPFAIGVRIEHAQAALSEAQFGPAWERL